ncbi:guanosine polyphosphate pyrophosphohydrolase [uncultured Clostridium sp.]|uniref:guanosine polyphosphate pyrophosphohydrolase n=1 Tax=uncultured Clostridium sp. TaxID=59620 RepID=UPI0028E2594B|nr:guanosine polyphosphate pyrophosphohydrolase [uncultured Clostridium sp.]
MIKIFSLIIPFISMILIGIWIVVDYKRYKVEKESCEVYKSLEDKVIGMHTEVKNQIKIQNESSISMDELVERLNKQFKSRAESLKR